MSRSYKVQLEEEPTKEEPLAATTQPEDDVAAPAADRQPDDSAVEHTARQQEPTKDPQHQELLALLEKDVAPYMVGATVLETHDTLHLVADKLLLVKAGVVELYTYLREAGVTNLDDRTVAHLCATALLAKAKQREAITGIMRRALGDKSWDSNEHVVSVHAMVSIVQEELWQAWSDVKSAIAKRRHKPAWCCILPISRVPVTSQKATTDDDDKAHGQWKAQSSGDSWGKK
eukprot:3634409-Amphidinium_carterae.1